jgi:tetratricopeptide (TPR) repeat protein
LARTCNSVEEGDDLYRDRKFDEAIKCYDLALESNPEDKEAWAGIQRPFHPLSMPWR